MFRGMLCRNIDKDLSADRRQPMKTLNLHHPNNTIILPLEKVQDTRIGLSTKEASMDLGFVTQPAQAYRGRVED